MLSPILWIALISTGVVFFFVIIRVARYFMHFPTPAFAISLINNPLRRRLQPPAKVIQWMDISPGMTILEIGPGTGTFTFEAASRAGEKGKVFAVDIQPEVISTLERKIREKKATIITEVASACQLPFKDRTFDRVFMVAVLAEIPDRKKALQEVYRVLKDTGVLAVGEVLPDPDYPLKRTVISWCRHAGFELQATHQAAFHYLLTFTKSSSQC